METLKSPFNIRAYGILIQDGFILLAEETRNGFTFFKFPGGGLEFGEGLADCLIRECQEELGRPVKILSHFYTTDFFQESAFDKKQQLISVYFKIAFTAFCPTSTAPVSTEKEIVFHWVPLNDLHEERFMFPVDQKVAGMLKGS